MKQRKAEIKTTITVAEGTGWKITFDRFTQDYAAHMDGAGIIGWERTQTRAQSLIDGYAFESLKRAA